MPTEGSFTSQFESKWGRRVRLLKKHSLNKKQDAQFFHQIKNGKFSYMMAKGKVYQRLWPVT